MFGPLLETQSDLVVDVVVEVVVAADSFDHFVPKVHGLPENASHPIKELPETAVSFFVFLMPVDEQ